MLELIIKMKQLCNFDPVSGESGKMADIEQRLAALSDEGATRSDFLAVHRRHLRNRKGGERIEGSFTRSSSRVR